MFYYRLEMEQLEYKDEGCDLFPSCLHCPLPKCRYDEARRQTAKELRNKAMLRLHEIEGLNIEELAERFGVSKRTVYRIIGRNHE